MITWEQWVRDASGRVSAREIASETSYSASSVSLWMRTGRPPAAAVIEIARTFGADIVVGLVCAGWVTREEVLKGLEARLQHVPTTFLVAELSRRADTKGKQFADTLPPGWDGTG